MATPKDITPNGEDPISNLKERFDEIWDELWDAFVDEYKYSAVADDAEFNDDSLVIKAWDEEKKSIETLREEERKRIDFFNKYRGVLNPYIFDDHKIYEEFINGNVIINEPFTVEKREKLIEEIKKRDKEIIEKAFKQLKKDDKQKSI